MGVIHVIHTLCHHYSGGVGKPFSFIAAAAAVAAAAAAYADSGSCGGSPSICVHKR